MATGRLEIYASFVDLGGQSSRQFLFGLGPGDHIFPIAPNAGDTVLIAVAVEETEVTPYSLAELAACASIPDQRAALAILLDGWLSHFARTLSRRVGPPPRDIRSLQAGERIEARLGDTLTALGGVAWFSSADADLAYCGRAPLASLNGETTGAAAPGLWLTASVGEVSAVATVETLRSADWPARLANVHAAMLRLIEGAYRERRPALRKAVEARAARTGRNLERAFRRFDETLSRGRTPPNTAALHSKDEPFVGVFAALAHELGIDITNRHRLLLGRSRSVDEAARALRLRHRAIALQGDWRRQDLGPLIGFLDKEKRPVALIPAGSGRWRLMETEDAKPRLVDAALAARLAPRAHMLYPSFPNGPVGFRQFLGFIWPRNRRDVVVAVLTSLLCALLGLATPAAMQLAFDQFIPGHQTSSLLVLGLGLALAVAIAAVFRFVFDMASLRIDGRSAGALQGAIMDRVLRLPESALRLSPGNLATRITAGDAFRRSLCSLSLTSVAALFFLISNIAWMFYYSPAAAAAAIGLFFVMTAIAAYCGYHQLGALTRGEEILSDIYGLVFQLVEGVAALRATGSEQRGFTRWANDFAELRSRSYKARIFAAMFETALVVFELLALAVILFILAELPRDDVSTGVFISFIAAYGAYMGASLQLARAVVSAWNAKPSWGRVAPLLRASPEDAGNGRDPGALTGAIDLTNVYFRYGADAQLALQGVSLSIAAGEFVALVGPSGSGKSTLMRLLLGFHMPLSGTVQYDQQDLRFLDLQSVRRQIGVVLQNTTLFPGSLYENIMANHDGSTDDAWEAARQAGIADAIKALPMGMHTLITEASAAFSGGEVQRFAIARALVSKPRVLLLDEATSAVDNLNQAIISDNLQRLAATRIVIAHRLNTIKRADRIVVLDRGKIVQTGRYDDLIAAKGLFADLAKRQFA